MNEETIQREKFEVERKTFILTLKENRRGRFLRITEDVKGRRDSVIVPVSGLDDFRKHLDSILQGSSGKSQSPSLEEA